jgi:ELWxxDGT repeat protein
MSGIFFSANGDDGWGLYQSDGTASGTKLVALYTDPLSQIFAVAGGAVVVPGGEDPTADFYSNSGQLLRSFQIDDLEKYSDGQNVYYSMHTPFNDYIYVTDGTEAGTKELFHMADTYAVNFDFFSFSGSMYLKYDYVAANESVIYKLDAAGSTLAFQFSSTGPNATNGFSGGFLQLGDKLIFANQTTANGGELWVWDGSTAHLLKDIAPGAASSLYPGSSLDRHIFVPLGDKAVFLADDGTHGTELWVTDGTAPGTHLLKDTTPGAAGGVADTARSAVVDGKFYFLQYYVVPNTDGLIGYNFWSTDGTTLGTQQLHMTFAGHDVHAIPTSIGNLGTKLFFEGFQDNNQTDSALYSYDVASGQTQLIKNINTTTDINTGFSQYDNINWDSLSSYVKFGNRLMFNATDFVSGDVNSGKRVSLTTNSGLPTELPQERTKSKKFTQATKARFRPCLLLSATWRNSSCQRPRWTSSRAMSAAVRPRSPLPASPTRMPARTASQRRQRGSVLLSSRRA